MINQVNCVVILFGEPGSVSVGWLDCVDVVHHDLLDTLKSTWEIPQFQ